jgi:RNA polymerase sigma factor (sigma-70 family)
VAVSDTASARHTPWPKGAWRFDLTERAATALKLMMNAVAAIPPFETMYRTHRDEILAFLRRKLGRDRAEDAFQETFLRALRVYGRLEHGLHLRAWLYTIAGRVALDELRRRPTQADPPEPTHVDGRPAYAELEHLSAGLPPTERAAVVLRYGYDLAYSDIALALGSTEEAARQAASSGIRRLRRKELP